MLKSGEWSKGYRLGFYPQIREIMEREYGRIFAGETTTKKRPEDDRDRSKRAARLRFAKTAG